MRRATFLPLIICLTLAPAAATAAAAAAEPSTQPAAWHDGFFPYRVGIRLDKPIKGKARIDLPIPKLLEAVRTVSVDVTTEDTLAYDKAVLVDPNIGKVVGGFRLAPHRAPVDVDGQFENLAGGHDSKWKGDTAGLRFEEVADGDVRFRAMTVERTAVANSKLSQDLTLKKSQLHLLEYRIRTETTENNIYLALHNPAKRIFNEVPNSYYNKLTPHGRWTAQRVLYRPETEHSQLVAGMAFVGKAALGDVRLREADWVLLADLPSPASRLDLYVAMNAGHRMTAPQEALVLTAPPPTPTAKVKQVAAEASDLNPDGVAIDAGDGVAAWTVPSYFPLRAETLKASRPRGSARSARATVLRGNATTILLAIETGTPHVIFKQLHSDLPVPVRFERIASIPVFDGFFPDAKRMETRFDALVEPNFALCPPDANGVHMLACTLTAPPDAKPGRYSGKIQLEVQTQEPATKTLELPVELTVPAARVKPMRHFGTIFGSQQFTARYRPTPGVFSKENVTVAAFCGYDPKLEDDWMARLSLPDRPDPAKDPIRDLARKYFHRMLDFNVVPQHMTLFSNYTYDVTDNGEGKAPKLTNWDFTEYDKAIDEVVIARDAPWLTVWHTNGHVIDIFMLGNEEIYSTRPPQSDFKEKAWRQIPMDEYISMVSDYFEQVAAHLETKGVLDRAIICLDEADQTTYELVHQIIQAIRAKPHARRIKVGHTSYNPSMYTAKTADGKLIMDEVLDVPMPINDEHFNHFEPEWAGRMKRPGKQPWVYYVETDHFNLENAGLSTLVTPLKLRHFGVKGWYNWGAFIWSYPGEDLKLMGFEYPNGPLVNPWLNPYYHHGHGLLSFFYPPDPRGIAERPTDRTIPSYRLALMRDGIGDYAMLDVLQKGVDDEGQPIKTDAAAVAEAVRQLDSLWAGNPVQWYISYESYRKAHDLIYERSLQ